MLLLTLPESPCCCSWPWVFTAWSSHLPTRGNCRLPAVVDCLVSAYDSPCIITCLVHVQDRATTAPSRCHSIRSPGTDVSKCIPTAALIAASRKSKPGCAPVFYQPIRAFFNQTRKQNAQVLSDKAFQGTETSCAIPDPINGTVTDDICNQRRVD